MSQHTVTVSRIDVALVSADGVLAEFYAAVFDLTRLPAVTTGSGVVHQLQAENATIKVVVPARPPAISEPAPFIGVTGIRYLTLRVDDLATITERFVAHGGELLEGRFDIGPGARISILRDPDGNHLEWSRARLIASSFGGEKAASSPTPLIN